MSNRTLIELNHDYAEKLVRDPEFIADLQAYIRGGMKDEFNEKWRHRGCRVIGMKHHSDSHDIAWGGVRELEGTVPPPLPTRRVRLSPAS